MFDYGYIFVFLTIISGIILYAHVTDSLVLTRYSDRDKIGLFIITLLLLSLEEYKKAINRRINRNEEYV